MEADLAAGVGVPKVNRLTGVVVAPVRAGLSRLVGAASAGAAPSDGAGPAGGLDRPMRGDLNGRRSASFASSTRRRLAADGPGVWDDDML